MTYKYTAKAIVYVPNPVNSFLILNSQNRNSIVQKYSTELVHFVRQ